MKPLEVLCLVLLAALVADGAWQLYLRCRWTVVTVIFMYDVRTRIRRMMAMTEAARPGVVVGRALAVYEACLLADGDVVVRRPDGTEDRLVLVPEGKEDEL